MRLYGAVAIGFNVLLSLFNVSRFAGFSDYERLGPALLAATVTVPLHIRHVAYGIRGVPPPGGLWTLAALALAHLVAARTVGIGWLYGFSSLAVSILIVVRGPWAPILAGAVVLSPLAFTLPASSPGGGVTLPGTYLTMSLAWRTVIQIVPVWLVTALRQAIAARRELEARAVIQDRVRIDTELRAGLGGALTRIVALGEAGLQALPIDQNLAATDLRALLTESRRTLSDARRVVAAYCTDSVRAQLETAATLLGASGVKVRLKVDPDVGREPMDRDSQAALRVALLRALRQEGEGDYRLEATRAADGSLRIAFEPNRLGEERQE
jgi:two-component system, NarL family, sensor histidine kinase DesK